MVINKKHAAYQQELKNSGVSVAAGLRVIKNKASSSPYIGFTTGDAYNSLEKLKSKHIDGGDANSLL